MIRARSVGRSSTGNEVFVGTVVFDGLVLAIVTGSMSGIMILRFVASRNTFLRCGDIDDRNGDSLIRYVPNLYSAKETEQHIYSIL